MSNELPIFGHPRGKLPFAPEGWPFIIPTAGLLLLAYLLCWTTVAVILFILLLFLLNFFRDPNHQMPVGDGLFMCPANGKVIRAEMTEDGHQRVDIFMNVFDVHVNRAPMAGRITAMDYIPGKFVNASFDSASEENERNRFEMECDNGSTIAFTQISGLMARRIVSYVRIGDQLAAGERIGMIRFGSRLNCEIPADYTLNVTVGDKVTAGLSIIARQCKQACEANVESDVGIATKTETKTETTTEAEIESKGESKTDAEI
ncbi:phosphatidylserine decarboxylase [Mariprofundus ferrooxydans]|nr:phosphatidylserine decarboxylase [Mariprofundus ferrooxydans]